MKNLNRILTAKPTNRNDNLQKEYVDIEVEGGMLVLSFVEKLDKVYGLALPVMSNYAGQTVAGVASTSTHGSGYFAGTLVCEINLFGRWGCGEEFGAALISCSFSTMTVKEFSHTIRLLVKIGGLGNR